MQSQLALGSIDGLAGTFNEDAGIGLLGGIYSLVMLIPGIAVLVRRLHDTNHSGGWLFIILIPLIGVIVLLLFGVRDSDSGKNQYGANPKGRTA